MLHIITNHHSTLQWLELQSRYLDKYTTRDYKVYCGITDIDEKESLENIKKDVRSLEKYRFFTLQDIPNNHADKLNSLFNKIDIEEICDEEDLLVFLDPDAFPVEQEWDQMIKRGFQEAPAIAISREENPEPLLRSDQKSYPHPCFFATTMKFWKENKLSWELDASQGASCAGVLLKKWFDENHIKWGKIIRTNCMNLHPLNFGVYGNIIYHHGSGNRPTYDSVDIWTRPELSQKYGVSLDLYFPELLTFNKKVSDLVFNEIKENNNFIRMYFCGRERL